jgi:hypothetical protein
MVFAPFDDGSILPMSLTKFSGNPLRCSSLTHKRCRTSHEPSSRRSTKGIATSGHMNAHRRTLAGPKTGSTPVNHIETAIISPVSFRSTNASATSGTPQHPHAGLERWGLFRIHRENFRTSAERDGHSSRACRSTTFSTAEPLSHRLGPGDRRHLDRAPGY